MTTDEMILALVAKGFTLPPMVTFHAMHPPAGPAIITFYVFDVVDEACRRATHDLCAMHFARHHHLDAFGDMDSDQYADFCDHIALGDSEAAIRALYEAVIGEA